MRGVALAWCTLGACAVHAWYMHGMHALMHTGAYQVWRYLLWQELERAHAGRRRLRAALAEQRDSSDGQITELHRSMVKRPPWQGPGVGSCASSGSAWQL